MPERGLGWEARELVAGWVVQSGILVPCDVTVVAAPRLLRYYPSSGDLGTYVLYNHMSIIYCLHVCYRPLTELNVNLRHFIMWITFPKF